VPRSTPNRSDGRSIRLIRCLRLLESACYTVDALAEQFRVSRRTVYRDLRLLAAADVPLMSQGRRTGRGAGIRAYHVPTLPPTAAPPPPHGKAPEVSDVPRTQGHYNASAMPLPQRPHGGPPAA